MVTHSEQGLPCEGMDSVKSSPSLRQSPVPPYAGRSVVNTSRYVFFRRDAEAVVRASDGREVDRRDELAPFPVAPDEDDDVVVVVVGDEPLKALP